jgi:hypothetical protein
VAARLAADFAKITCLQKEEAELKDAVADIVAKAMAANTVKGVCVNVQASGSGTNHPADGSQQSVSLSIQQICGFVE